MTYEMAETISKLPVQQAHDLLNSLPDCTKELDGETLLYHVGEFTFFKCFEDSKNLYFEC